MIPEGRSPPGIVGLVTSSRKLLLGPPSHHLQFCGTATHTHTATAHRNRLMLPCRWHTHEPLPLKPTHKPVLAYYAALAHFHQDGHKTEGNTRSAFADLLKKCASPYPG
jgi:hypothetical protein